MAAEEDQLAEIFNFYAQLGRVVWLDEKLTLNEKQFVKLAGETGCSESSCEDAREVFRWARGGLLQVWNAAAFCTLVWRLGPTCYTGRPPRLLRANMPYSAVLDR